MRRIELRARYSLWEPGRVVPGVEAPEGVAGDQDIWARRVGDPERVIQLVSDLSRGAWGQTRSLRLGPAWSYRAAVETRRPGLDVQVVEADRPDPGEDDHRRRSTPGAVEEERRRRQTQA